MRDTANMWGKAGGADPQRADLWQVDLTAVVNGLFSATTRRVPLPPRYFTASVELPEQKVRAERVMRDSRVYNMPSWDEPLEAARITFYMDDGGLMSQTKDKVTGALIYQVMDLWRKVVRAGRGAVGAESEIMLSANTYRVDYAYPITIYLLKGYGLPAKSFTTSTRLNPGENPFESMQAVHLGSDSSTMIQDTNNEEAVTRASITEVLADQGQLFKNQMESGLFVSGIYVLEKAWLSGFKVGTLTYQGSTVLTLDAQIYAENILVQTPDQMDDKWWEIPTPS